LPNGENSPQNIIGYDMWNFIKFGLMLERRFYFQFDDMKKIGKIFNKIKNLIEFTL
jgi:hypothetical protein